MKKQNISLKLVFLLAATVLFGGFADQASAATYTVDTISDSSTLKTCSSTADDCSLRGAISKANSNYDRTNTIVFAIPLRSFYCTETRVCTITLTNGMLSITPNSSSKSLTIRNSTGASRLIISGNSRSAVFFNDGILTLDGVTITKGRSTDSAGGILNTPNGTLTLTNSVVMNNTSWGNSAGSAGGVFNGGQLTANYSTISGNRAVYSNGGGIASYGSLSISNSTISDNSAGTFGGGIYTDNGEVSHWIVNSTISGNTAGRGGGIYNLTMSMDPSRVTLTLQSVTVTNNMATLVTNGYNSGGIVCVRNNYTGGLRLYNSIVAGNNYAAAPDIFGSVGEVWQATPSGASLIGDGTGATIYGGGPYLIGTAANPIDPLLGPLANNGGPTKTHPLLLGSPAIDTGSGVYQPTDQRGFARNVGGYTDMGAYELQ